MGEESDSDFRFSLTTQVLVLILIGVLIFFAVLGNIALLFAIYAQPRLRTTSNLFIGSLAASNLMTGLYTMPLGFIAVAFNGKWMLGDAMCELGGFIDQLTICAGMVTLGMTSVDRYILVCHAIKYPDIMTRRRCWFCITLIWVWSITVSLPPLFGWSEYTFSESSYTCASGLDSSYFRFYVSATFPLPILIIFPTYYCILRSSMGGGGTMAKRHRGNLRTAKIILLIIIIFAVCVFPVFMIGIMLTAGVKIPRSYTLAFSVIWLLIANSGINPILYGLLNKNFRAVYMRMVQRCLGLSQRNRLNKSSPRLQHSSVAAPSMHENHLEIGTSAVNNLTADTGTFVAQINYNNVIEDHDVNNQYEIVGFNNNML